MNEDIVNQLIDEQSNLLKEIQRLESEIEDMSNQIIVLNQFRAYREATIKDLQQRGSDIETTINILSRSKQ